MRIRRRRTPVRLRADDYTEIKFPVTGDGPGAPLSTASFGERDPDGLVSGPAAPLWPMYGVNLGTLLRTGDAVGAGARSGHGGAIIGVMAEDSMTWAEVAGRLAAARNFWVSSTTGSGAPHAAPVWGAVTGGTLYLYTERSTVKARNLAADPRVTAIP